MNPGAALEWIESPSITAPLGWTAGAVEAGIKKYGDSPRYDVGILASARACSVAGVFTQNRVVGAPVEISREKVHGGVAQALVVNSGCSNVALGERGRRDAQRMCELVATKLGIDSERVLVGSTGVIGRPLPMDRITHAIDSVGLSAENGSLFSRAIMTTDRVPKCRAVKFTLDGVTYTVAGTAKGSGMAHPDMATVFCFLTTDAAVGAAWLKSALKRVVDRTLNLLDIDMDTSTSDMMLAFANGAAAEPPLDERPDGAAHLEHALLQVCTELTKDLARDGEGARTLIEAVVSGALSVPDARLGARTIVSSPLVKTMVTGADPNLGRVLMALGRSGATLDLAKLRVWIGPHLAFDHGTPTELDLAVISQEMKHDTVTLRVDLGLGTGNATAWGCDLTEEYVRINADYTT